MPSSPPPTETISHSTVEDRHTDTDSAHWQQNKVINWCLNLRGTSTEKPLLSDLVKNASNLFIFSSVFFLPLYWKWDSAVCLCFSSSISVGFKNIYYCNSPQQEQQHEGFDIFIIGRKPYNYIAHCLILLGFLCKGLPSLFSLDTDLVSFQLLYGCFIFLEGKEVKVMVFFTLRIQRNNKLYGATEHWIYCASVSCWETIDVGKKWKINRTQKSQCLGWHYQNGLGT